MNDGKSNRRYISQLDAEDDMRQILLTGTFNKEHAAENRRRIKEMDKDQRRDEEYYD